MLSFLNRFDRFYINKNNKKFSLTSVTLWLMLQRMMSKSSVCLYHLSGKILSHWYQSLQWTYLCLQNILKMTQFINIIWKSKDFNFISNTKACAAEVWLKLYANSPHLYYNKAWTPVSVPWASCIRVEYMYPQTLFVV